MRKIFLLLNILVFSFIITAQNFSQNFQEQFEKLQPKLEEWQYIEVLPYDTTQNCEVPEPGQPIQISIAQLELLHAKYLLNIIEEISEPEVILIGMARATFLQLVAAAEAYPETPPTLPQLHELENFILGAEALLMDRDIVVPVLKKFSTKDLSRLFQQNTASPEIVRALQLALPLWKPIHTLTALTNSLAISSDGKTIVGGDWDAIINIWDIASGRLLHTFPNDFFLDGGHGDWITSVAISQDSTNVVTGSRDRTIMLWDIASGKVQRTFPNEDEANQGHTKWITGVAITPDGLTIVSGSDDCTIKIWDRISGKLLHTLPENFDEGHRDFYFITSVTISHDGRTIISGSYDGTIKVWDLANGKLIQTFTERPRGYDSIHSVTISHDSTTIIGGSYDGTIKLWDRPSGRLLRILPLKINSHQGHTNWVISVALSQDDTTIISYCENGTIKIWDRDTGRLLQTIPKEVKEVTRSHPDETWAMINSMVISPDGTTIVRGFGRDKTLEIWQYQHIADFCATELNESLIPEDLDKKFAQ